MTTLMPLQTGIIYGPVHSRRFGESLGINLLPAGHKVCTMDCVYCQYHASAPDDHGCGYPRQDEILEAARRAMYDAAQKSKKPDWIMLSGNGEPTLHPEFEEAVELLIRLRDAYLPSVRVGILSNSTTCHREEVYQALYKLDGRFMKLDAGSEEAFDRINRPVHTDLARTVKSLQRLARKGIVLQSMFVSGHGENIEEEAVDDWIDAVRYIAPSFVQIYSLDRAPKEDDVLPVSAHVLNGIADRLRKATHIPCAVFTE